MMTAECLNEIGAIVETNTVGDLLHLLDDISNDTQLVHGGSFQAGGHSGKGSVPAS